MESTAGHLTANNIPIVAKSMPPAQRLWGKPRERIMHLLDRSRRQRFTFLNAPAGYGKTTALADWFYSLTNAGEKAAWFAIDRRDRDSKCFWLNFHYAICTALGIDFVKSLGAVQSMARNEAILTMANEMSLSARKCGGLFIVIEGLDVIYGFETLEELLTLMLALSGNVHIILSSRVAFTKHSFPGFTIPDVALNIDYSMLALTKQEMLEYLLDAGVEQVEEPDLNLLHDKTQGWPAGTAIVMDSVDAGVSFKEAVANLSGTDPRLNEFFEFEVFSGLSQEEKDFLLKTASLGMISTRVAGYTLGDVDVDTVISSLHRRNAFFFPIDTNSGEYELHPLFSQWVMKKAQILSSHEQRLLNARASRWCLRNGLATAAAKHKILASEREDIFNLVRVAYPNMTTAELMSITMSVAISISRNSALVFTYWRHGPMPTARSSTSSTSGSNPCTSFAMSSSTRGCAYRSRSLRSKSSASPASSTTASRKPTKWRAALQARTSSRSRSYSPIAIRKPSTSKAKSRRVSSATWNSPR